MANGWFEILKEPRVCKMNKAVGILYFLGIMAVKGAGIGFEAPDYQNQAPPGTALGWSVIGEEGGKVTDEQSAAGNQSLALESGESLSRVLDETGDVFFLEIAVLPTYEEQASPVIDLGGARLGFRKIEGQGHVVVFISENTVEIDKKIFAISPEDDLGEDWVRITVRVDRTKSEWDLFLDGMPAAARLALGGNLASVEFGSSKSGTCYYDEVWQGIENPLFGDVDKDGMPDVDEKTYGLNPYADDREGDFDGDGISNIQEVFSHGNPVSVERGFTMLYVDNLNGSDANTGRSSYGKDVGPKASIEAAMQAAKDGDTIVILKGMGEYFFGEEVSPEKNLKINPIEEIEFSPNQTTP
jgi:hypothetical protein